MQPSTLVDRVQEIQRDSGYPPTPACSDGTADAFPAAFSGAYPRRSPSRATNNPQMPISKAGEMRQRVGLTGGLELPGRLSEVLLSAG